MRRETGTGKRERDGRKTRRTALMSRTCLPGFRLTVCGVTAGWKFREEFYIAIRRQNSFSGHSQF